MATPIRYANSSGNSSVVSYEIHPSSITLIFRNGMKYRYVKYYLDRISQFYTMISLAKSGKGLNTYINRYKPHYTRKTQS